LRPYRRNYVLGLACFLAGLAMMFSASHGVVDTLGGLLAGGGFLLAGWSGRQWWYYEKQLRPKGPSSAS